MRSMALMLLVAVGLAGCGTLEKPSARVLDAALVEETSEGSRLEFVVEVRNPRDTHYPLVTTRYALSVEEAGTFRFTEYPIEALPARDEAGPGVQRLLLAGALPATDLAGRTWSVSGSVSYRPPGEIREILTDSGVPLPIAAFSGEGTLRPVGE